MRLALLIPAAAGILLLAACTSPSAPVGEPTTEPTSDTPTTAPVDDGAWPACDDATIDALTASLDGQLLLAPQDDTYPLFLPAPSCIAYPTDQGISIAFFLGADTTDFEEFEAGVVDQQGQGDAVPDLSDGVLAAETWDQGGVIDLRYFSAGNGVSQDYIQATSVIANYTPGG